MLLDNQFNYLCSTMSDRDKRLLDPSSKDCLDKVLRLRPEFKHGLAGLLDTEDVGDDAVHQQVLSIGEAYSRESEQPLRITISRRWQHH